MTHLETHELLSKVYYIWELKPMGFYYKYLFGYILFL